MKNLLIMLAMIPLLNFSVFAGDTNNALRSDKKTNKAEQRAEAKVLVTRLHEIRDLAQKQNLTQDQKNDLRKEVLDIKKELREKAGIYLYLSMTTLIIILLLIILL